MDQKKLETDLVSSKSDPIFLSESHIWLNPIWIGIWDTPIWIGGGGGVKINPPYFSQKSFDWAEIFQKVV